MPFKRRHNKPLRPLEAVVVAEEEEAAEPPMLLPAVRVPSCSPLASLTERTTPSTPSKEVTGR